MKSCWDLMFRNYHLFNLFNGINPFMLWLYFSGTKMLVHSTTSCQYSVDFIYNKHSVIPSINELLAQVCPIIFYQLELLLVNLKSIDQAMQGKHYRKIIWTLQLIYVVYCTIWYHLYNLKNVENTHGGVLILVKLQALHMRLFNISLNMV